MLDNSSENKTSHGKVAGVSLVVSTLLAVFMMAHHPTGHGHSTLNAVVHGSMILLVVWMYFGFALFCLLRGITRPLVLAGLIAYTVNMMAALVAATMNGFVAPEVFTATDLNSNARLLALCWEINQAAAKLAVYATAFAYTFWGLEFVVRSGLSSKLLGVIGIACGVGPILFLVVTGRGMDLGTAHYVYAAHFFWVLVTGIRFIKMGCGDGIPKAKS